MKQKAPKKPHKVTMAELVPPKLLCGSMGCKQIGKPREACPYTRDLHDKVDPCNCCDLHYAVCLDGI